MKHLQAMLLLFGAVMLAGCDEDVAVVSQVERGRELYLAHCVGCHGINGDGRGEVAAMLDPAPRDFTTGEFKFSSRRTPDLPTDEDLKQVLRRGLAGTSMSSFAFLSESEMDDLIAYIKTLSSRWEQPQGPEIARFEDPFENDPEAGIRAGDEAYHVLVMCYTCHPAYHSEEEIAEMTRAAGYEPSRLRENPHWPVLQENADGTTSWPPDFRRDAIKSGSERNNLYRVIGAGITTTAMPTWVDTVPPEQLWGLAYYVNWLASQRPERLMATGYRAREFGKDVRDEKDLKSAPEEELEEEGVE